MPITGIQNTPPIDNQDKSKEYALLFRSAEEEMRNDRNREKAAQEATIETSGALRQLSERLDQERDERIAAEKKQTKENRIWQSVLVTISLLTLAATILGILVSLY